MHAQFLRLPRQAVTVTVVCALAVLLVALHWSSQQDLAVALHDMPCADLDGDGEVTTIDEQIIWSYWGQNVPPAPPQADLQPHTPFPDNDVDTEDIAYLVARIGQFTDCQDTPIGPKASTTPTPTVVPPVGGIAVDQETAISPLDTPSTASEGMRRLLWPAIVVTFAMLFAVAWTVRRRVAR